MNQKAWYVFREETTQGPFNEEQLLEQKADGLLHPLDPVWSDGMEDWTPLNQTGLSLEEPQRTPGKAPREYPHTPRLAYGKPGASQFKQHTFWKLKIISKRGLRAIGMVIALGIAITGYRAYQQHLLQLRVQAIEGLEGIPNDDVIELRRAATEPFTKFGISAAVALSRPVGHEQLLILATNLAGTGHFDIQLAGNPETLIDATQASGHLGMTTTNGIGAAPFSQEGIKELPRGEYQVKVFSTSTGRFPNKPLTEKTIFLGKPKDFEYVEELKAFHSKLKIKARDELLELGQFVTLIEEQLTQTVAEFQALGQNEPETNPQDTAGLSKAVRSPAEKERWETFHIRWSALYEKLESPIYKWTPSWLATQAFYSTLFKKAKEVTLLVKKIHVEQNQLLAAPRSRSLATEIKIAKSASLAQSLILALKAKIQLMEKIPLTLTGMPQQTLPQELDGL